VFHGVFGNDEQVSLTDAWTLEGQRAVLPEDEAYH